MTDPLSNTAARGSFPSLFLFYREVRVVSCTTPFKMLLNNVFRARVFFTSVREAKKNFAPFILYCVFASVLPCSPSGVLARLMALAGESQQC